MKIRLYFSLTGECFWSAESSPCGHSETQILSILFLYHFVGHYGLKFGVFGFIETVITKVISEDIIVTFYEIF